MIACVMPASLRALEALVAEPGDRPQAVRELLGTIVGQARQRALWAHLAAHGAQTSFSSPVEAETADTVLQARLYALLSRLYDQCLTAGELRTAAVILDAILMVCTGCNLDLARLLETWRPERLAERLEAAAIPPNVQALLAYQLLRQKRPEAARDHVRAIAPGAQLSSTVFPSLCLAMAHSNMRPEGRRVAEMAPPESVVIRTLSTQALFEHIGALIQLEDIARVKRFLRAMDADQYSDDMLGLLFCYMVRFEDPDRALRLAPRLRCNDRIWREVYLFEALANRMLFRYENALDALENDLEYNGLRDANVVYRAQFHWECNEMEQAIEVLEEGLAHPDCATDPVRGDLHNLLAVVLRSLGRLDEALWQHDRAVALYPEQWRVYAETALTLLAAGQKEKAFDMAIRGSQQGRFTNNFCEYLVEILGAGRPGTPLSLAAARKCFDQARYSTTPWLPLQAHRIVLALASFQAHGDRESLRAACGEIRMLRGALTREQQDAVCDALENGATLQSPSVALAFARGAFPHLPDTGYDRRQLVALAMGTFS